MKLETSRYLTTTLLPEPQDSERTQDMHRLYEFLLQPDRPALVDQFGSRIEMPEQLYAMLRNVLELLLQGRAIVLIPRDEELTTQAAANMLGVSRPYLVKRLLDPPGKIPFTYAGSHRRIKFSDLMRYMSARDRERHEGLSQLTRKIDEAGLYDDDE
jgi:excisionase family DNA binding protein